MLRWTVGREVGALVLVSVVERERAHEVVHTVHDMCVEVVILEHVICRCPCRCSMS